MDGVVVYVYISCYQIRVCEQKMDDWAYIKFNDPKAKPSPPSGWLKRTIRNTILKIVSTTIPKCNPDFDHLLNIVDYWKIEYNKNENATWREIGFDKDGVSIVAMPLGDNYGYWTDNHLTLDDYKRFESATISAAEFENDWTEFESEWRNNTCRQKAMRQKTQNS